MAAATLKPDAQSFPPGTKVKVKLLPSTGGRLSGEPPGSLLSEPTVATAGTLTVTELTENIFYVGYASVGGVDRYVVFSVSTFGTVITSTGGLTAPQVETLITNQLAAQKGAASGV